MASTQKSLRLLRNATLYTSKELAFNALSSMTGVEDGVPVLARYTEAGKEKTLLGLYSKIADGTKHMTIFDFDSDAREALEHEIQTMSGDITNAITTAINNLDKADTAVEGEYVSSVSEENGIITVTRVELPTVAAISETGKPIVSVSQTKGAVTASTGSINAEFVNIADAGEKFTATTVEAALAEVVNKYEAADTTLKNDILGDATTSGNTLGKLEDRIEALDADAKEYHIVKTTGEGLPAEIKERYSLVDAAGNVSGATIDIPKDSHIVSIRYISDSADTHYQNLEYTYLDVNGVQQTAYVDMSELVLEAEFASGVTATNHVVHGVVPTSETFLTVGAAGFKLSGVQDAINSAVGTAVSGLDYTDTAVAGQYVSAVSESDGVISVERGNVSEAALNNYAKGSKPADMAVAATDTINQAIAKLEHQVDDAKTQAQASKTIVQEGTDNSHLEISSAIPEGSSAVTYTITLTDVASETALTAEIAARKAVDGVNGDAYTADTNAHYISDANSLYAADQALDTALSSVSDKVDTLSGKSITGIEMTGGTAAITANTDGTKKITINADATTVSANTITGSTNIDAGSVQNALQTIYDTVNAKNVVGSNAITTSPSGSNTQVSLKLDEQHSATTATEDQYSAHRNALQITDNGLFLSDVWDAGTY